MTLKKPLVFEKTNFAGQRRIGLGRVIPRWIGILESYPVDAKNRH